MSGRMNVTVDVVNPRTTLDWTAVGVLNALQGQGWVFTQTVKAEILVTGGDPMYMPTAVKALRNMGYALPAIKARHESRYRLDATPAEMEDWRNARTVDAYSMQLTLTRSLAGALSQSPRNPLLSAYHAAAEGATIQMGRAQGIPLTQIVADLTPL